MMMFGLHFMNEVPFRRVLLSGLIVDETGDKMSKVKGNVIDPLDLVHGATSDVVEGAPGAPEAEALDEVQEGVSVGGADGDGFPAFGADALRFTLATFPPSNKRIALAPEAHRGLPPLRQQDLERDAAVARAARAMRGCRPRRPMPRASFNRWILSRLSSAARIAHDGLRVVPHRRGGERALPVLLERLLRLVPGDHQAESSASRRRRWRNARYARLGARGELATMHPFIPFVTEELWQRLKGSAQHFASIALEPYPTETDTTRDVALEAEVKTFIQDVTTATRTIRAEHAVHRTATVPVNYSGSETALTRFGRYLPIVTSNTGSVVGDITAIGPTDPLPKYSGYGVASLPTTHGPINVHVGLKGLVDPTNERGRIDRELKKIEKDLAAVNKKLSSPSFTEKAPKEVIDEANGQKQSLEEARARLVEARALADEL